MRGLSSGTQNLGCDCSWILQAYQVICCCVWAAHGNGMYGQIIGWYLSHFNRLFEGNNQAFSLVAALSSWVSDSVLELILEDSRGANEGGAWRAAADEEVSWILSWPYLSLGILHGCLLLLQVVLSQLLPVSLLLCTQGMPSPAMQLLDDAVGGNGYCLANGIVFGIT